LNAVCPDGFEYYFVDEQFVVNREFGLAAEYPVHLGERECKLFTFRKNVCVPEFFNFEKAKKNAGGLKSGEYGGWSIFVMDFLARNSRTLNVTCAGALSWWIIHL
jgi:hypothetical protein